MFLDVVLLPAWMRVLSAALSFLVILAALRHAEWQALWASGERINSVGASFVLLVFLQLLSIEIEGGLQLHLLGVTTATLLIGLRFTLLVGAASMLLLAWYGNLSPLSLPTAWLLSVAVPAAATRWLVWCLQRRDNHQPFLYIMGAGFGGGILSALATAIAGIAVLAISGQSEWVGSALSNWPVIALIAFPEGFINGTLVTAFVVLAPDAMKLYDAEDYGAGAGH